MIVKYKNYNFEWWIVGERDELYQCRLTKFVGDKPVKDICFHISVDEVSKAFIHQSIIVEVVLRVNPKKGDRIKLIRQPLVVATIT